MSEPLDKRKLAAEAIYATKRPHKVIEWPGAPTTRLEHGTVALVVLARQEILEAQIDAARYLLDTEKLDPSKMAILLPNGIVDFEQEIQILSRALRDPDSLDEVFSAEELRGLVEAEVQESLIRAYSAWARERSPLTHLEDLEALKRVLRDLKTRGALSDWVKSCAGDSLRNTALALADLWLEPTSESSSAT